MSIKGNWVDGFVDLLVEHDEAFSKDTNYAYQLAFAYFDWADVDEPEYTVEEAFQRYLANSCYG